MTVAASLALQGSLIFFSIVIMHWVWAVPGLSRPWQGPIDAYSLEDR